MWRISAVPTSIWFLLLFPSGLVAVLAALRRTNVFILMLFFSLTTVAVGAAESFYTVFVLERFDGKFRNAPQAAFELDLFGDAIVAMLGVLMFGGTLALLNRRGLQPITLAVYISATLGGVYMTMPSLLYAAALTPPVALSWLWLLLFPIISARLALRSVRGAALDRSPTPSASIPRSD